MKTRPSPRGVDLDGAVVVITGASSGIGRAAAQRFAARHAHLFVAARSADSLHEVVAECRGAGAASATACPLDVADQAAHDRLRERALTEHGRIDVWVNDAGVMAYGRIEEVPADVARRIVEVNLLGTTWGTRAVVPVFRRQRRGVLINISSLYGKMATPYVSAYASTKFGILGLTQTVRQELHDVPDVAVCAVLPGSIDTPIFGHAANYTGRRVRPVPPVSSVRRVADAVVDLAVHPRAEVEIGRIHHLVSLGHALMPRAYGGLAPGVMRFVALGEERAEAQAGNVFDARAGTNAVTGQWQNRPARIGVAAAVTTAATALAATGVRRLVRARPRRAT